MARPYRELRFDGSPEEINAQWLEARKQGIGGSDAAGVLGMSKYATPLTVWLDKTGRSEPKDLSDNEKVYWGTVLEDVVAKEFAKRHPDMRVRRRNAMLVSKERPWAFASIDRIVTTEDGRIGILEIKTAGGYMAGDWEDGIPDYYIPQPTHYLAVTGFDFYAVAVLIGGNDYREFFVERDEEDIAALVEREDIFWHRYVETDTAPAVTSSEADSNALLGMHSEQSGEYVEMLDQDVPQIAELIEANAQEKEIKERKKLLSNEIKAIVGDAKGISTPTRTVTWSRYQKKTLDGKRLKAEQPELYESYTNEKPHDGGLTTKEAS